MKQEIPIKKLASLKEKGFSYKQIQQLIGPVNGQFFSEMGLAQALKRHRDKHQPKRPGPSTGKTWKVELNYDVQRKAEMDRAEHMWPVLLAGERFDHKGRGHRA